MSLCKVLRVPAGGWSFPARSPRIFPQVLAPIPRWSSRCLYPFLPKRLRPSPHRDRLGTSQNIHTATSVWEISRGGSHSVMTRLPCLLASQMAPTAQPRRPAGSRVVYTPQWTGGCPPELWYRYISESENCHDGTFTRWIAALSAATCNYGVKSHPSHHHLLH
jgi:hypothetical protein